MTRKDLISYDYVPQLCRVGTLYFKNPFCCSLNEKTGEVDFRYESDDLHTAAIVHTLKELGEAEKAYYDKTAEYLDKLAKAYKNIADNYKIPKE